MSWLPTALNALFAVLVDDADTVRLGTGTQLLFPVGVVAQLAVLVVFARRIVMIFAEDRFVPLATPRRVADLGTLETKITR